MVNNPELGRCEFLGYYCKAGNYKEGCLELYNTNLFTKTQRTQSGLDYTYGTPSLRAPNQVGDTFTQSSLSITVNLLAKTNSYVQDCLVLNGTDPSDCDLCKPGFLLVKTQQYGLNATCLRRCPDGQYPYVTFDPQYKSTLGIKNQTCAQCDAGCGTCMEGGAEKCTSCRPGEYLFVTNQTMGTGNCQVKVANATSITLTVTGQRTLSPTLTSFPDLVSALRAAHSYAYQCTGLSVTILLKADVDHFVTIRDIFNAELPLREMIDPTFSMAILYVAIFVMMIIVLRGVLKVVLAASTRRSTTRQEQGSTQWCHLVTSQSKMSSLIQQTRLLIM
ncbi:hypothetical protein FGO68_gene11544 [Halteria grandinella]|uniref:Uncharacterized protein n=1 Tax=Halteria grandinella TaxID=5974 RepID=A0A8J8TBB2_HALGN|nr:hypothetical protein FGO68_gene11544 [Halteria grandinella]